VKDFCARLSAALVALAFLLATPRASALEPVDTGRSKITSGVALMVSGALVTGLGAGLYVANERAAHTSCAACANTSWVLPTVLMGVGSAMFVGGIPILVLGAMQRSKTNAPPTTATISIGPFGASARLSF